MTAVKAFFLMREAPLVDGEAELGKDLNCHFYFTLSTKRRESLTILYITFMICIMISHTTQLKLDSRSNRKCKTVLSLLDGLQSLSYTYARYIMGLNCPFAHLLRDEQFVNTAIMGRVL